MGTVTYLLVLLGVLSLVTCFFVLYSFYKIRRIHLMTYDLRDRLDQLGRSDIVYLFQSIQLLRILESELQLDRPLPPMRGMAAGPDFLLLLARHARAAAPQTVLECGSGVSTLVLARCLQLNGSGHVYSLEQDPQFAAETRDRLAENGLMEWATVVDAPLTDLELNGKKYSWYKSSAIPANSIDMLIVDGPPTWLGPLARYPAGPLLLPRLNLGGTVFVDDTVRSDEANMVSMWLKEFPDVKGRDVDCEKGCAILTK